MRLWVSTRIRISFFWLTHLRARNAEPNSRLFRENPLSICHRCPQTRRCLDPRGLRRNRRTICRRYFVFGHFRPAFRRFKGKTVERTPSRCRAGAWLCSASKAPSPRSVSTGQRPQAARAVGLNCGES